MPLPPFSWKAAPTVTDPDHVTILGGWDVLNITSFACEELSRWTRGHSRIVTMNHSVKDSFLALWAAWEKAGLLAALPPAWGGAYNPRYKRGVPHDTNPNHLSNHASGHAFDICPARYPLGVGVKSPTDPILTLAKIAESMGWRWGGHFARPDPMHFQSVLSPFT